MEEIFDNKSIGFLIKFLARQAHKFFTKESEKMNLDGGAIFLLKELSIDNGISQNELSKKISVDKAHITRMACKLEENGFILREPDDSDARIHRLVLTKKGEDLLPEIKNLFASWTEILSSNFTEQEKNIIREFLLKMCLNAKSFNEGLDEK